MESDSLTLKWGTLKSWRYVKSQKARDLIEKYLNTDNHHVSAMMQRDTQEQKELICQIIDSLKGKWAIQNDWDVKIYNTKKAAKDYVMNYGKE